MPVLEQVYNIYEWSNEAGFESNALDATPTTGFVDLFPGKKIVVTGVQILFSLNAGETVPPTITVTVNSRPKPYGETETSVSSSSLDDDGWVAFNDVASVPYHQVKIAIGPTNRPRIADLDSFRVAYVDGGDAMGGG